MLRGGGRGAGAGKPAFNCKKRLICFTIDNIHAGEGGGRGDRDGEYI